MNSNVVLNSGKSLPIDLHSCVIIGPKDSEVSKFANSEDTKKKLLEVIQPAHLGLKVKRMYISSNNKRYHIGRPAQSRLFKKLHLTRRGWSGSQDHDETESANHCARHSD